MASGDVAFIRSGHAGIVAARARAKVHHRLLQIVLVLAGEARCGSVALEVIEVTPDATHRGDRGLGLDGDVLGRLWLLQIGPFELRKIFGEREQILLIERGGNWRHQVVLLYASPT